LGSNVTLEGLSTSLEKWVERLKGTVSCGFLSTEGQLVILLRRLELKVIQELLVLCGLYRAATKTESPETFILST
jgi:hypothetical protein